MQYINMGRGPNYLVTHRLKRLSFTQQKTLSLWSGQNRMPTTASQLDNKASRSKISKTQDANALWSQQHILATTARQWCNIPSGSNTAMAPPLPSVCRVKQGQAYGTSKEIGRLHHVLISPAGQIKQTGGFWSGQHHFTAVATRLWRKNINPR